MSPGLDYIVQIPFLIFKQDRDSQRENGSFPEREEFLFQYFLLKFQIVAFPSRTWLEQLSLYSFCCYFLSPAHMCL